MQAFIARWKPRLRKMPGYRIARFLYNLAQGMESRNAALLLLRPPVELFQPYGTTSYDRFPEIFQLVREWIGDGAGVRVLSFGCSTGEEVFSLRRYFSEATIVGIDINPFNIAVCRVRLWRSGDKGTIFATAGSTTGQADASYDAIFAMAVFRHGDLNVSPPPPTCDHRIRFADFERSVTGLARCIKPGGLLVIHHAMFRFGDTCVAAQFEPIECANHFLDGPLFDRENRGLPAGNYPNLIFRKLPPG